MQIAFSLGTQFYIDFGVLATVVSLGARKSTAAHVHRDQIRLL